MERFGMTEAEYFKIFEPTARAQLCVEKSLLGTDIEKTEIVIDAPRSLQNLPRRAVIDINTKWDLVRCEMQRNPLLPLEAAMARVSSMFTILPLR